MRPTLDHAAQPAKHVVENHLEESIALLNLQNGECIELDQIGSEIWEVLRETGSLRAVVARIATSYQVAANVVENDVLALAHDLASTGMIDLSEPGEPPNA